MAVRPVSRTEARTLRTAQTLRDRASEAQVARDTRPSRLRARSRVLASAAEKHVSERLTSAGECWQRGEMPLAPEIARAVDAAVDSASGELASLSKRIHANPELRFEETKAAGWICDLVAA